MEGAQISIKVSSRTYRRSISIFMDEIYLFSGDYLLPSGEDSTIFPGGSKEDYETYAKPWIQSLKEGLHIYPGHGEDYILTK